ncbi:MAG: hypothetical protein ACOCTT_00720 [archaeon]
MATTEKKEACPICFSEKGQSIILKKEGDEYVCPRKPNHRFKKQEKDGFLVRVD